MQFSKWMRLCALFATFALVLSGAFLFAQETTGGLQGTVKDASGAVVGGAHVVLTGTSLVGKKELNSEPTGYYRFANLPPGVYTVEVSAKGFKTVKREGVTIEVGHLPTLDLALEVGATAEVVEVTGAAPLIDTTTETTLTNVTADVIKDIPHGYSFQSVIQFAPGARNEPLAGGMVGPNAAGGSGTGGQSAGSGTNGGSAGYSIGGGADSENSYLVEGQETADAVGGFSHTNVPFSFIQEVQVKSSGVDAEYGGALGGVVNVIMNKGANAYHGSVFSQFESGGWDGSAADYPRYNPTFTPSVQVAGNAWVDATAQDYQPKRDTLTDIFPGFNFGGPIKADKLWFFVGFNPEWRNISRTVNWSWPGNAAFAAQNGPTPFSSNTQTYYTNARLDYVLTQKIRVFGSWLYEYQRQSGEFLPAADSTLGLLNPTSTSPPEVYGHNLGFAAPNTTTNIGADISLTPQVVATFRWGYNFQNYHDFGMPTGGAFENFSTSGVTSSGAAGLQNCPGEFLTTPPSCPSTTPALSSQWAQGAGYFSAPNNINNTTYDVTHHNQINADLAVFKSGWAGTHNIKFGYQLNRLSNAVEQHYNEPNVTVFPGSQVVPNFGGPYSTNCATEIATYGACTGQYGYVFFQDYGSLGQATSVNHAFFVQDAWTIGHGITLNAGIRLEHEYLPAEDQPQGGISKPINFSWGDKFAPRLGAAWDVMRNGKWKVFGSYGKFYDIMKLNLAISSFGGQYWNNCYYTVDSPNLNSIIPQFNSSNRYCGGAGASATTPANFGSGGTPAGLTFIENQNFRTFPTTCSTCTLTEEGVAPGLKPYTQHESVFGMDHQFSRNVALEVRWDRRRLDHVIEDSALYNPNAGETFVIVNPGQGVNRTFDGMWNFLYGTPSGCVPLGQTATLPAGNCGENPPLAIRSYDGVEFRLTKANSNHWAGMFSYTYSHFRGNYTGLTNTDISDGGGGRNAPNNSRAFDEPFFYYGANGGLNNGLLPTDRPSVFKGYAYYELGWMRKFTTNLGLFQYLYQGTPEGSFMDVGNSFSPDFGSYGVPNAEGGAFPTYVAGRDKWLPLSQDPTTGVITAGTPVLQRTPWFTQTDLQLTQNYKISETKTLGFTVTVPNALNQRATVAYWQNMDSDYYPQYLAPTSAACAAYNAGAGSSSSACGQPFNGYQFYAAAMSPSGYNLTQLLNNGVAGNCPVCSFKAPTAAAPFGAIGTTGAMSLNSLYGQPLYHQTSRRLYMAVKFTF